MAEFLMPDIGEGLQEAEIVKWYTSVGDFKKENDLLVEVTTDKATVEITAPFTGEITALGGEEGDFIAVGSRLVQFKGVADGQEGAADGQEEPEITLVSDSEIKDVRIIAPPAVRKRARLENIDLMNVPSTHKTGKITMADLDRYQATLQQPQENKNNLIAIRGVRRKIFQNMMKATSKAVLCTGMSKVEVSKLVHLKKQLEREEPFQTITLSYLPFIIRATALALEKHKKLNAIVHEKEMMIELLEPIHIGVATDTSEGLVVPVIADANKKSVKEIAMDLHQLLKEVHAKQANANQLTGSTFTISNTGAEGGTYATPITNYPEVSILGVHAIEKEPVIVDNQIQIGQNLTMSCTFDHRIIDGADAGQFMQTISKHLQNPMTLLI